MRRPLTSFLSRSLTTRPISFRSSDARVTTRGQLSSQVCCFSSFSTARTAQKPNAVFLNAGRLDYDQKLDFSRWHELCDTVVLNRSDAVPCPDEMLQLVCDHNANIVIAKEIPIPVDVVQQFPATVQLICEAGTGYNNWPIDVARAAGIPVCNIPTYSTEAVAHMAITYLMNLSCSMFDQQRMLWENDRSNFLGPFTLPVSVPID